MRNSILKITILLSMILGIFNTVNAQVPFNVTVLPMQECDPGYTHCSISQGRHVIKQCDEDGLKDEIIETCGADEVCDYDGQTNPVCILAKKETEFNNTRVLIVMMIMLVILVFMVFSKRKGR